MLLLLFIVLLVIGLVSHRLLDDYYKSWADIGQVISTAVSFISAAVVIISLGLIIPVNYLTADAEVSKYNAKYEALVYQYENDVYDNDNDLGKRELIAEIQRWNEDLAFNREMQYDPWVGVYYPIDYYQFEFIELGGNADYD